MKNKLFSFFLFFCASVVGVEKIDMLFYLQDAGETYALMPVIRELKQQEVQIRVLTAGVAEELLPPDFERLDQSIGVEKNASRSSRLSSQFIEALLEAVEPRLVITGVAYVSQGQVLDAFRQQGVPTFAYWDNLNRKGDNPYFTTAEEVATHANQVLVPTRDMENTFSVKSIVVGQPTLEEWQKAIAQTESISLRQQLGICSCQNIVLFIGGYGEEYEQSVELFGKSLQQEGLPEELFVLIQPHPKNRDGAVEQKILEKANISYRILQNEITTQQAVAISDLIACHQSTVAFQALAAGKPVVHFIPSHQRFTSIPLEKGLALKVIEPEDFPEAWERAKEAVTERDFFDIIQAPKESAKLCAERLLEELHT